MGSQVCERLVKKGYEVTGVSRRGTNPRPNNDYLEQVNWVKGDATNPSDVQAVVANSDAIVHAVGLLFDVDSGLQGLNTIVSGSNSLPEEVKVRTITLLVRQCSISSTRLKNETLFRK